MATNGKALGGKRFMEILAQMTGEAVEAMTIEAQVALAKKHGIPVEHVKKHRLPIFSSGDTRSGLYINGEPAEWEPWGKE